MFIQHYQTANIRKKIYILLIMISTIFLANCNKNPISPDININPKYSGKWQGTMTLNGSLINNKLYITIDIKSDGTITGNYYIYMSSLNTYWFWDFNGNYTTDNSGDYDFIADLTEKQRGINGPEHALKLKGNLDNNKIKGIWYEKDMKNEKGPFEVAKK